MRYKKQDDVFFLNIKTERTGNNKKALFDPNTDTVNEMSIHQFKCTEHWKVRDQFGGAFERDGFVFTDLDGNEWGNQYPVAIISKTDHSHDWSIKREYEDGNGRKCVDKMYDLKWYLTSIFLEHIATSKTDTKYSEELFKHFNKIVAILNQRYKKIAQVVSTPWKSKVVVGEERVIVQIEIVDKEPQTA